MTGSEAFRFSDFGPGATTSDSSGSRHACRSAICLLISSWLCFLVVVLLVEEFMMLGWIVR